MAPTSRPSRVRACLVLALALLSVCLLAPLALAPAGTAHAAYTVSGAITFVHNGKTCNYTYGRADLLLDDLADFWDYSDVSSATVDMYEDWDTQDYGRIDIPAGKSLTLNMHGHMLNRHTATYTDMYGWYGVFKGEAIYLNTGASLTVNGGTGDEAQTAHIGALCDVHTDAQGDTNYAFWGYDPGGDVTLYGGLITGGSGTESDGGGAIAAGGTDCTVSLNNVTLAGNIAYNIGWSYGHGAGVALHGGSSKLYVDSSHIIYNHAEGMGGGVYVRESGSWVSVKNGSEIAHNYACEDGGGIAFDSYGCALYLLDSTISYNNSDAKGGGIYAHTQNFQFDLRNGQVNHNRAKSHGGGLYLDRSKFNISGSESSSISFNTSTSGDGGGVCLGIDESDSYKNSFFTGVTFEGNECPKGNGGGLYLNQELVHVSGRFLNNKAGKDGGAVCISNDDNEIESDVIKGNTAGGNGGGIYNDKWNTLVYGCKITENVAGKEGGGIFTAYSDDIELGGVIIIRDNKRADGADDDLFLSSNVGNTIRAYVHNSYLWNGSSVGIRTGIEGDRLIATKVDRYREGTFFLNQSYGYHLSYSADTQELYQRVGAEDHVVTVNGQGETSYAQGETVTLNAYSYSDGKSFLRWDASSSSGLWNISDVTSDPERPSITFTMPGNDVHLTAIFSEVACQTSVRIDVDAPVPGQELPTTATLTYTAADGTEATVQASVAWYEVSDTWEMTPAEGVAKFAANYGPEITVPRNLETGLAFWAGMGRADVDLRVGGARESSCTQAHVDGKTGTLTAYAQMATTRAAALVTFDSANGQEIFTQEVEPGACAQEPTEPTREGYVFLGWYAADGSAYRFDEAVDKDITLTAAWDAAPPASFADVPEGTWFHDWVMQASSLRIMTGYKDRSGAYTGFFGPDDTLTRGQVATVLWRMAGNPAADDGGAYPDVEAGQYYSEAVSWCASVGIVTGYKAGPNAGHFLPNAGVSREELALMVWRFEVWAGVDVTDPPAAAIESCEDAASVSDWAKDACTWCAAAGVMSGKETDEGTLRLDPQQGATRSQAAKMLVRAHLIQKHEAEPYAETPASEGAAGSQATDSPQATEAPAFDDVTFEDAQGSAGAADEGTQDGAEGTQDSLADTADGTHAGASDAADGAEDATVDAEGTQNGADDEQDTSKQLEPDVTDSTQAGPADTASFDTPAGAIEDGATGEAPLEEAA